MEKLASANLFSQSSDPKDQWETGESKPVEKQEVKQIRFTGEAKLAAPREVDIEIEYSEKLFSIEPGLMLQAHKPLKLGYREDAGALEVIGWGIEIPLGEGGSLPAKIARRFLDLFSRSQRGNLSDEEALQFSEICSQVDYRAFCAARALPRWQEAWLVHKEPVCYLDFGTGNKVKLTGAQARSLQLLNIGDYFGAWFAHDRDGKITGIKNIEFLPDPVALAEMVWPAAKPVEFDPELKSMLPDPQSWAEEE